eukprot:13339954-Ditylum_brightwellii.AAC.1
MEQRASWRLCRKEGWYLGSAVHYHTCYTCYTIDTKAKCTATTVNFDLCAFVLPHVTPADSAAAAVTDLIKALQNSDPKTPWSNLGNEYVQALK